MTTLAAWTCYGLAYIFVVLYLQFYYETGSYVYVPKRLRLRNRIKAHLTRLASRWRGLINKVQWNINRRTRLRSDGSNTNRDYNNNYYTHRLYAMNAVLAQQATARKLPPSFILDSDSKPLGIDNRATAFISGDINDFDGPLHDSDRVVRGFAGIRVKGVKKGTAVIRIEDDDGRVHRIKLRDSYYVPDTPDRLFSPQHFAQEMRRQKLGPASETTDDTSCILRWGGYRRTIRLDPETNVATIRTAPSIKRFMAYCAEAGFDDLGGDTIAFDASLISDDEGDDDDDWWLKTDHARSGESTTNDTQNSSGTGTISNSLQTDGGETEWSDSHLPNTTITSDQPNLIQQEDIEELKAHTDEAALLDFHYRFGHTSFAKLQTMAKNGVIPRRLAHCRVPACAACMYGKATHRPWRHKRSANDRNSKPTTPGQTVSVDQLKSPTPGFIAQLTGALTKDRYNYATVFVDNYSGKGYVHLQRTQSAAETVEAKLAFERICQKDGVKVQHYHADNGVFRAKAWTDDCLQKRQRVTFAGVDAHHQNGRAEARIRRLQELTRSALNHAQRQWPQEISTNLWPYALRMASDSLNATPNMQDKEHKGRTPDQAFSGSDVATNPKHWKHFGSPVYVLDQALRGGSRIHGKWKDRSRIGIYLGRSPQHARSIALVLNPETGLVSPQFHVQHDSSFDTIKQLYPAKGHKSKWQEKTGFTAPPERPRSVENSSKLTSISPQTSTSVSEGGENGILRDEPRAIDHRAASQATANTPVESTNEPTAPQHTAEPTRPPRREHAQRNDEGVRRSGRASRPPQRLLEIMTAELCRDTESRNEIFSYAAMFPREDISDIALDIIAMKATADPDSLYLHEARKQPDWENFADAMLSEIEQQIAAGVLIIVPRSDVPEGAAVLPSVWQLRRKRDVITGDIRKYKARNNIDGSKMVEGRDYDETYAPVAGWTAIRLILAFKLIFGWYSVQLDYVLAFPQAPAVRDLYMEIPKGFTLDGVDNPADWVLKMGRNIYGGKDSGRVWYLYLVKKLLKLGFRQSKHDDCIFYKGKMIYVLYTDDSILTGPDKNEIDETIKLLASELDITHDDQLSDFLGVNIQHRDDGTIKLSQPKLIDQVINDLHLEQDHTTIKPTPAASSKLLSRHEDSRPFDGHFNYRSVIGKLHYLVAGSRSEIAYAVHQCARFAHDPKMEHSKAVKWIGRYLKGTRDAGTILRPDKSKSLEVFVDADFAGNWDPDIAGQDRSTARSRHGYYICYGGIPIAWKSTLQQEIALSSTESEITGLSYALRETIPIIRLLEEMEELGYPVSGGTKVHCEVFEDNSGAIEIARKHKYRPRTKHLNNRLWHFRTYVDRGVITILPIKSEDQPADILTKPLNEEDFKKHRLRMNGH
jgi:Reverse transcriptase (RNA-dependent DNA polymerase)